jgi:hypothetical protein
LDNKATGNKKKQRLSTSLCDKIKILREAEETGKCAMVRRF